MKRVALIAALLSLTDSIAAEAREQRADITSLPAVTVTENRLEAFGFDVMVESAALPRYPYVIEVMPNTAASKAGLRPGDRILKTDGKSAGVTKFTAGGWYPKEDSGRTTKSVRKAEDAAKAGRSHVVWTLEVETRGVKEPRTLRLELPTPPPRWGGAKWQRPEGRPPAVVTEPGPLAERCREVLENGIWSFPGENIGARLLVPERDPARFHFLGYIWRIESEGATHRIFVTQQRGRTEVLLSRLQKGAMSFYFTSPAGTLEKSVHWGGAKPKTEAARLERDRVGFQRELEFWLKKVGAGTGRWPFEVIRN